MVEERSGKTRQDITLYTLKEEDEYEEENETN